MRGLEVEHFGIGACGNFQEGKDFLSLHGLARFAVAVIDGHDIHALGRVNFMAQSARKVAAVLVHHCNRQVLRLSFMHERQKEDIAEEDARREQNQVARALFNQPQLPTEAVPQMFHDAMNMMNGTNVL